MRRLVPELMVESTSAARARAQYVVLPILIAGDFVGYLLSGAVVRKHGGNLLAYGLIVTVLTAVSVAVNLVGMRITYNHSLANPRPKSRWSSAAIVSLSVPLIYGLKIATDHQHGVNAGYFSGALESIGMGLLVSILLLAHQARVIQRSRVKKPHGAASQRRARSGRSEHLSQPRERRRRRRPNHKIVK